MPSTHSLAEVREEVEALRGALAGLKEPPGLGERGSPGRSLAVLGNLARRLAEGPRAPVRVAVFGPTGAGKSKLFNSIVREPLSPSSYRRPCTRRPLYWLHESRAGLERALEGDVRLHRRGEAAGLALIDAPDFDSVEAENRAAAERIYLEADAFVFVADVHKYADASVWVCIEAIRAEGKGALFVLNKVEPSAPAAGSPLEDFRRRLGEAFRPRELPGPVVAIAERPLGDEELLPEDDPGVRELRGAVDGFLDPARGGGRPLLAASLRLDLERFLRAWDALAGALGGYSAALARLRRDLAARFERSAEALRGDLAAELDPALKGEVYREVLRRIERFDLLRYPRQLLALPAQGLKRALGWLWPRGESAPAPAAAPGDEPLDAANLARLEERVRDLVEETSRAMRAEPACPGLLDEPALQALRVDHDELRRRYRAAAAGFQTWAEAEARSTAATLTTENKAKFILSQVLYNTVVIGIQVKTAGALTLAEMLADGVLSPLVAKAAGMAVSSGRVREFEERARREHARRMAEVLGETRDRLDRLLAERGAGLEALEALKARAERLRSAAGGIEERFLRSEGSEG